MKKIGIAMTGAFYIDDLHRQSMLIQIIGHKAKQVIRFCT